MSGQKVPVQSLIDHIKTAIDVDPWAKDMAEELLKGQDAVKPTWRQGKPFCGACGLSIQPRTVAKYCYNCGRAVKWDAID